MALAAREVHIATGDDHAVAVERNVIVDPESGVAAKVENVAVAVDLGGGNVGIAHQQKVVGIGLAPGAENTQATPGYYHQQGGYPPQYPQQPGYPPQQPPYPGYPPTAYPQQQQYAFPAADKPPPYHQQHSQPQQQPAPVHNVVVIQQPQQVVHTVRPAGSSDYGSVAMVIAIGVTIFILLFGCWWSLICSIAGIILASNASSAGVRGDYDTAKSNSNASIGCSITGGVSVLVGLAILIGIALGS